MIQSYVVGFLFNSQKDQVVLIKKIKPAWQKDSFNGVGGKIEEGETPEEAMQREFFEETGVIISNWEEFAFLDIPGQTNNSFSRVWFFRSFGDYQVKTTTEEAVDWYSIKILPRVLPNLYWLLPLALTNEKLYVSGVYQ